MMQCQFQIITDETLIGRLLRKMLPISYGLIGLFLTCALFPATRFLLPVIGMAWIILVGSVAVVEWSGAKLYQTEGVIKLNETGIVYNSLVIHIADLRQVEVKFNFPRGQGAGSNGIGDKGNRIIIHSKFSVEEVVVTVLVETRAQRNNLTEVLKQWRKAGIIVSADGIDLV